MKVLVIIHCTLPAKLWHLEIQTMVQYLLKVCDLLSFLKDYMNTCDLEEKPFSILHASHIAPPLLVPLHCRQDCHGIASEFVY